MGQITLRKAVNMAKEFIVTIDVTMSGDIYVEADTKEEAIKKAKAKYFYAQDLKDFHYINSDIVECEKNEE